MTLDSLPGKAQAYILYNAVAGLLAFGFAILYWDSPELARFPVYLLIAVLAGALKVHLPGITATMSVNFLFVLVGILELGFGETLVIGCAACLVQSFWKSNPKPRPVQVLFNVSSTAKAITLAYWTFHLLAPHVEASYLPILLALSATVFFLMNTVPVSMVVSLIEGGNFSKMWSQCYFWSFPYYLVGAALAGGIHFLNGLIGWQITLLSFPVVFWIYRSYRLYLGKLESEKRHAEELAGLHLRTIEALALAIDAKDQTTHDHLRRVRVYAEEIGKDLGLDGLELEALRAAALLHDIGKLAVPEHILNKPGRLTPEEFEKIKIHPTVGAEILEQVKFPYPVAPIVRSHHEKWDGSGYPDGLTGEAIPIGARILTAVDVLDALASDRQYRRALPLRDALTVVVREAGKSFDPQVVQVLERRFIELESKTQAMKFHKPALSTDLKVEHGAEPAAGFENTGTPAAADPSAPRVDFLSSIAGARQEGQMLFELSQSLGNSLSLDETLSVFAVRLKRLVQYDSIAIYLRKGSQLVPEYVSGEDFRLFSALRIPMGEGLSGWVAEHRKPIVNGNPSVEPGYLNDPHKFSSLRSGLAVPLEGVNGVVGVLSLYAAGKDAFTADHLRMLLAISSKVGLAVENGLKYQIAENSATTDYLTNLPNARSLFLHLDREVARAKRANSALTVLVCDLDGFKQVNDRFGHLAGNTTLQNIARRMREICREYDYVARMGGDEFVVVAPNLAPKDVPEIVLRLRQLAEEAGREVCGENLLSMSVGEAYYPLDGTDAEKLLAEADRQMYRAKEWHHEQAAATPRRTGARAHIATIQ